MNRGNNFNQIVKFSKGNPVSKEQGSKEEKTAAKKPAEKEQKIKKEKTEENESHWKSGKFLPF